MGKKDVLRKKKAATPVAEKGTTKAPTKQAKAKKKSAEGPDGHPLVKAGDLKRPVAVAVVKKVISTIESADRKRYSDDELVEFEVLLLSKRQQTSETFERLKASLSRTDSNDTVDTSTRFKLVEETSESQSREETAQLAVRQEKYLQEVDLALLRIRDKTYGICRVTGRLITKERLRAVPTATMCIEAKQQRDSTMATASAR